MNEQVETRRHPLTTINRLAQAVNDRDLEALVACFDAGYVNETPAHPERGFRGSDQVRTNWTQILAAVPDITATVSRTAVDGNTVWTEWELCGTRRDGSPFLMRGAVIFDVAGDKITRARFYLEPVEESSGDVNDAVARATGNASVGVDADAKQ